MKLETVTIDLGKGDTATVFRDVLRVTARLHQALLKRCLVPEGSTGKVSLEEMGKMETAPRPKFMVDMTKLDDDEVNEVYVLNQVVEWTLGPVNRETLDRKMTREQYKTLVSEMDRIYRPVPFPPAGSGESS